MLLLVVTVATMVLNALSCTLTYTASQPAQIGPVTTIYDAIMTTMEYAVDCDLCTVTNIPEAVIQGPFSLKSTSSMLTITHVTCIPQGTASTRGVPAATGLPHFKSLEIFGRSEQAPADILTDMAVSFSEALPAAPGPLSGSGGLQQQFTNIASALFGLSICDSGIQLNSTCNELNTDSSAYTMLQSGYNPDSVKAIVCFCATNGYNFNTTRQELYADLYEALFGVTQAATLPGNPAICDDLSLFDRVGPDLGIDVSQYDSLVCGGNQTSTPTITPEPYVTNNMTTWTTATPTGMPSMSNDTSNSTSGATANTTIGTPASLTGSMNMTSPEATGTGEMPTATMNETLLAHIPRGPKAMPFYPVTTTESGSGRFKVY